MSSLLYAGSFAGITLTLKSTDSSHDLWVIWGRKRVCQATWSSPVTNRVLLEAGASYVLENQDFLPRPESVEGRITDSGFNIAYLRARSAAYARDRAGVGITAPGSRYRARRPLPPDCRCAPASRTPTDARSRRRCTAGHSLRT